MCGDAFIREQNRDADVSRVIRVFWSLYAAWGVSATTVSAFTENAAGGRVIKFVIEGRDPSDREKLFQRKWLLQGVASTMLERRRYPIEVEVRG